MRKLFLPRRIVRKAVACVVIIVLLALCGDKLAKHIALKLYPKTYAEYIEKYSTEYAVDTAFCYAMAKCESGFDANADSAAGAKGVMQLTDDTFEWICKRIYGEEQNDTLLFDAETNIKCGIYYLSYLFSEFGDERTVIAAYNAGPNKVKEWLSNTEYSADGKTLSKTPYAETNNHIKKVLSAKGIYKELYKELKE